MSVAMSATSQKCTARHPLRVMLLVASELTTQLRSRLSSPGFGPNSTSAALPPIPRALEYVTVQAVRLILLNIGRKRCVRGVGLFSIVIYASDMRISIVCTSYRVKYLLYAARSPDG